MVGKWEVRTLLECFFVGVVFSRLHISVITDPFHAVSVTERVAMVPGVSLQHAYLRNGVPRDAMEAVRAQQSQ